MAAPRRVLAAACLTALLAACGGGGDAGAPAPPGVVARAPAPGAVDATEGAVTVTFSTPMDAASVASGISVARVGGGAVSGSVATSGAVATFTPAPPLPAATALEVTVSADVRSAAGVRLGAPVSWTFTTAHWRPVSTVGAPTARSQHTAVWTGSEMLVWGGTPTTLGGGRYDPATDSWTATATSGAPAGRTGHTAIWTGSELIVWGGLVGGAAVATGGRYDPVHDTWTSLSTANAPTARSQHTAIWTGGEMIVWGGKNDAGAWLADGGRYDPSTDTWTTLSAANAPTVADAGHLAAWTGSRMAIWGAVYDYSNGHGIPQPTLPVGGLYDPGIDAWYAITTAGAQTGGAGTVLAWSGSELLSWSGAGARYTPATDSWIPMAMAGAPQARSYPQFAWTGSRLLVWGGNAAFTFTGTSNPLADGALFDPATDTWTPVSAAGSAAAQQPGAPSVWTGSELVVWGGGTTATATGARFTP